MTITNTATTTTVSSPVDYCSSSLPQGASLIVAQALQVEELCQGSTTLSEVLSAYDAGQRCKFRIQNGSASCTGGRLRAGCLCHWRHFVRASGGLGQPQAASGYRPGSCDWKKSEKQRFALAAALFAPRCPRGHALRGAQKCSTGSKALFVGFFLRPQNLQGRLVCNEAPVRMHKFKSLRRASSKLTDTSPAC